MLDTYMNALDLTFLSVSRVAGQELLALPGLLTQNPPQKSARGRDQDRLVVFLTLTGNVSYSAADYNEIVGHAAETFYSTPGSLTFALKAATAALNTILVDSNMKSTGKGLYSNASLVLCTLRGNSMYIVQSGPTHVYHLGTETRHLYDPDLAGKGLGLNQTARMYFSQVIISPGDRLLLCASLPPNWDKSLTESRGSASIEITKRRLLAITDTNVSAVLLLATEGSGVMSTIKVAGDQTPDVTTASRDVITASSEIGRPVARPLDHVPFGSDLDGDVAPLQPAVSDVEHVSSGPAEPDIIAVQAAHVPYGSDGTTASRETRGVIDPGLEASPEIHVPGGLDSPVERHVPRGMEPPPTLAVPIKNQDDSIPVTPQPIPNDLHVPAGSDQPVGKPFSQPEALSVNIARGALNGTIRTVAAYFVRLIHSGRNLTQKLSAWAERTIPALLPETYDEQPFKTMLHNTSIFFAVATPILLFVIARIIYYQLGFQAQYDLYYSRAQDSAKQALAEASPATARVEWQATLDWLDKADQFQTTPDPISQKFRVQAQSALDQIDVVVRVNFTPAFDLPPGRSVHVVKISATDTDVYFLDAVTGSVSRGVYNGHNYDIDKSYQCGPGIYNDKTQVGQLVDITALPKSATSNNTTLLGIDVNGNLLYCLPGNAPIAAVLHRPGTGWKSITAVVYNENTLYVLDAPARGVWFYDQDTDKLSFTGEPKIFFGVQIPVMLEQATGMAVNGNDLYLLHKDGHLATCKFSHDSSVPTRCNDPALYVDTRPGFQGGVSLTDGVFSQIFFTSVPVPTIALLEPFSQSIFHFSPRALELQNQIRPNASKNYPFPNGVPIAAMAFSPNKILFVFVDGQMYYSLNAP